MTQEQRTVLIIKGIVSELPDDQREACEEVAEHIRRVIKQAGEVGLLAVALVAAEAAV